MSSRHAGRAVLAGLALIGSLACGDSPITPQLQSNFGSLQNRFGAVCSRFNQVLDRRLRVDVDLPWGGDTPLDVRLFPSDWGVTC